MGKPHIHAQQIIAWANGAEIECLDSDNKTWVQRDKPKWNSYNTYRVKPSEPEVEYYKWEKFEDGYMLTSEFFTVTQAQFLIKKGFRRIESSKRTRDV